MDKLNKVLMCRQIYLDKSKQKSKNKKQKLEDNKE